MVPRALTCSLPRRLLLAVALAGAPVTPIGAQTTGSAPSPAAALRLELLGATERSIGPDGRVTLVVRVTGGVGHAEADVDLPQGWQLVAGRGSLELGTQSAPLVVSVVAPAAAAPGRYPIEVRVIPTGDARPLNGTPPRSASVQATVLVPARVVLSLQLLEGPSHLVAGQAYRAVVMVNNGGNQSADVVFAARVSRGGLAVPDVPGFPLAAGHQREVTVSATAPRAPAAHDELVVTVAHAVPGGADTVTARLSHRMRVVPREASHGVAMHTIPLTATIRVAGAAAAGQPFTSGTSYELVGRSPLHHGSATRLELLARYNPTRGTPHAVRNAFRAAVVADWGNITIGHAQYGLTSLTTSARLLLGAGAELRSGRVAFAAHAGYDDLRPDDTREAAAQLRVRALFGVEFAATSLVRQDAAGKYQPHHTARITVPLHRAGTVIAEGSIPTARLASRGGWALNASGIPYGFSYNIRLLDGDSTWVGPHRDVLARHASFSTPAVARVRLYAAHASRQQNRLDLSQHADSLGTLSALSDRSALTTAGLAVSSWLRAEHRDVLQSYMFAGARSLREERGLNFVGSLGGRHRFTATAAYFRGDSRSADSAEWRPFRRATVNATVRLGGRNAITVLADRQVTPGGSTPGSIVRTGLGAQVTLASRTTGSTLMIGGRQNRGAGISLGSGTGVAILVQRSVDVTLHQALPAGYRMAVRVRAVDSGTRGTPWRYVGAVDIAVPIALPMGVRRDVGGITVDVTDESSGGRQRGVLVLVGNRAAVTDRNGRVTMQDLAPGSYAVQIDRSTLVRGRVSTHDAPQLVTVVAGQRQVVSALIIEGATISGHLRQFDVAPRLRLDDTLSRGPVDVGGLPGFVIEASLGAERRRAVTDSAGAFEFGQLRAGEWTLRVVGGLIPDLHRSETAEQRVVVGPGGQGSAHFRIVAVTRTIRMLPMIDTGPPGTP